MIVNVRWSSSPLNLISIKGLHPKLWRPKVARVPTLAMGAPRQNVIWMWASWAATKYTIKGEGGGFPQVQVVVNLVSSNLLMAHPNTKSVPARH